MSMVRFKEHFDMIGQWLPRVRTFLCAQRSQILQDGFFEKMAWICLNSFNVFYLLYSFFFTISRKLLVADFLPFAYSVASGHLCTCRQQRVESMALFWRPLTCQPHRHTSSAGLSFSAIPELVVLYSQHEDWEGAYTRHPPRSYKIYKISLFCTLCTHQNTEHDRTWQSRDAIFVRTRNSVLGGLLLPCVLCTVS